MGMIERTSSRIAEATSAKHVLFELQVEQHLHDEAYHREIARLSLHQRLNHMALHFAKYAGRIAAASSVEETLPVYIDVLIIGISTANILNEEVWSLLGHGQEFPGLLPFARTLSHDVRGAMENRDVLLRETAIATGQIAAACEKIDHLEEISYRANIKVGLAKLLTLSLAVISKQGIDPATAARERLEIVKRRLKLHGRI